MKKTILILASAFMTASAFAGAEYGCYLAKNRDSDFGDRFTATVTAKTIRLVGTDQGTVIGKIDRDYRPRAKNEGSVRYSAAVVGGGSGNGCREAQVILNQAMARGENGLLVIAYDCDSDGSGPKFETFSCVR